MPPIPPSDDSIQIREVWASNLDAEFELIRGIVEIFPYVAMETEFAGIVIRPVGNFKTSSDFNYATLKANVDSLQLIQLCVAFSDGTGRGGGVWQFNFRTDDGVDARRFGELVMSSNVVLNDAVHWVTFHSANDFGYLLKLLTCRSLPETLADFFALINLYFPNLYDIKHLMKYCNNFHRYCNNFHGGLNELAELLDVELVGIGHQAGSDSLLTLCTFQRLKETFFNGSTKKYAGVLYGLGVEND